MLVAHMQAKHMKKNMNPAVFTCVLPLCFWELCDPIFISDVLKLHNELPLCGLCILIATLVSDFQTQELELTICWF